MAHSAALPGTRWEERLARRGGGVEFLRLPAAVFGAAARLRGRAYDLGLKPTREAGVPVISVGNLTSGGTGKTPMVVCLVRKLIEIGVRPALLSRGYGRAGPGAELNDEGQLLARLFPDVLQVQDPDRVRGAERLVREGAEVIVLDDGFQHRRLARDLDLVLIDATRPWGLPATDSNGPLCAFLPRGLMREPRRALARAHAIALTRARQASQDEIEALEQEVHRFAPAVPLLRVDHQAVGLTDVAGERLPLDELRGKTVDLVSAIGNPEAFSTSIRALGADVAQHRAFRDHHVYQPHDLDGLGMDGRILVTTAKDAVKLQGEWPRFLVLEVEIGWLRGEGVLDAMLDTLTPERRPPARLTPPRGRRLD